MQDKFEDLRTFVAVAQAHSFAAAGRQLGVAKSAISRRVQELEERLGARLINRSTRSVSLTESGRVFFEKATELLAALEEAEGQASRGAAEIVGSLRILAPSTFGHMHLVPLVCAFLERHSRLSIELMLSDTPVDLVAAGHDMAVRIGELRDSTLSARQLGTIRKVACASPAYLKRFGTPRVPKDLVRHRGIVYSVVSDKEFWRFVHPQSGKEEAVSVPSRLRLDTGDALRAAAIAGAGVTVLPTFMIHKAVLAGELVPLLLPFEKVPGHLFAVFPSRKLISSKVRAFVEHLAGKCLPSPYWDRDVFGSAEASLEASESAVR